MENKVSELYTTIAEVYDKRYDTDSARAEDRWAADFIQPQGTLLDVGCGTGWTLDNRVTQVELYRGIDPSEGMCRELKRKHPTAFVETAFYESWHVQHPTALYDTVLSSFGSPSYIDPLFIPTLVQHARRQVVLMHYMDGYLPDIHSELTAPTGKEASRRAAIDLVAGFGGEVQHIGAFQVVRILVER